MSRMTNLLVKRKKKFKAIIQIECVPLPYVFALISLQRVVFHFA